MGLEIKKTGRVKNIGNVAARKFEKGMGKPVGWMDSPHDSAAAIPALTDDAHQKTILFTSQDTDEPQEGYITFELLDIQAAAGAGGYAGDSLEVIRQLHVLKSWARAKFGSKVEHIHFITARGNSMLPTIDDGDILFVDHMVRYYDGDGIYVLVREHSIQVKRLQLLYNGNLLIISDNQAYQTETLSQQEAKSININGRVKAVWAFKNL